MALVIISLCVVAVLGMLATALTSSAEHRSLATIDTVVKSFAETAKYQIQEEQPIPLFNNSCSTSSTNPPYLLVSRPDPINGPVGTAVTVFGTGFTNHTAPTVEVNSVPITSGVTYTQDSNGDVTINFTIPSSLTSGTSGPVTISEGSQLASSVASFTVTSSGSQVPPDPVSGYTIDESDPQYWNTGTDPPRFSAACNSNSDTAIQELNLSATAPVDVTDGLSLVVIDPGYNRPTITLPPTVKITYPTTNTVYGANWTSPITGTATSNSGAGTSISSVTVAVEDTSTSQWWNGTAWQSSSAAIYNSATTFTLANNTWTYTFPSSNLTNYNNYAVTAEATDSLNNVGYSLPASFTYVNLLTVSLNAVGYAGTGTAVWSVGSGCTMLFADGTDAWSVINAPTGCNAANLDGVSIYGNSGAAGWAVGASGTVLICSSNCNTTGALWTTSIGSTIPSNVNLAGVWATQVNSVYNVYAVGTTTSSPGTGEIWSCTASCTSATAAWTNITPSSVSSVSLTGVSGGNNEVFAVGSGGTVLWCNPNSSPCASTTWTPVGGPVSGSADGHLTNNTTTATSTSLFTGSANYVGWGINDTANDIAGNTAVTAENNSANQVTLSGAAHVGGSGTITNDTFTVSTVGSGSSSPPATLNFSSVWVASGGDVYATGTTSGSGGTGEIWACSNNCNSLSAVWTNVTPGGGLASTALNGVTAAGSSPAWAVGNNGVVLSCTSNCATSSASWLSLSSSATSTTNNEAPTSANLLAAAEGNSGGDVWAVGPSGTIIAATNSAFGVWGPQASPTTQQQNAVAYSGSGAPVWSVGNACSLLFADGTHGWTTGAPSYTPSGCTSNLAGVSIEGISAGWAVGSGGTVLSCYANCQASGATWRSLGATGSSTATFSSPVAPSAGAGPDTSNADTVTSGSASATSATLFTGTVDYVGNVITDSANDISPGRTIVAENNSGSTSGGLLAHTVTLSAPATGSSTTDNLAIQAANLTSVWASASTVFAVGTSASGAGEIWYCDATSSQSCTSSTAGTASGDAPWANITPSGLTSTSLSSVAGSGNNGPTYVVGASGTVLICYPSGSNSGCAYGQDNSDTTTSGSKAVCASGCNVFSTNYTGYTITDSQGLIPPGTTISSVTNKTATLSQAATGSTNNDTFYVSQFNTLSSAASGGTIPGSTLNLSSVWAGDSSDIYMVGTTTGGAGEIFACSSTCGSTTAGSWANVTPGGSLPSTTLNSVTAMSKGSAWAVGNNGTLLYCSSTCSTGSLFWLSESTSASSTTNDEAPTSASLLGVATASGTDAWAVGSGGTILAVTANVLGVWGAEDS